MVHVGIALQTRSTPDTKNTIGKMKKEDTPTEDEKPSVASPQMRKVSRKGYPQFYSVAFPKVDGDEFLFFRTHVKPGKCHQICLLNLQLYAQAEADEQSK